MPARNGGKGRFNALTAIKGAVEGSNREVAPRGGGREREGGAILSFALFPGWRSVAYDATTEIEVMPAEISTPLVYAALKQSVAWRCT